MRRQPRLPRRSALVGLALLLAMGCFMDEIDKASSWRAEKKPDPAPAATPQTPARSQGAPKTNWWATAKSLGSEESTADIVGCKVGNSTHFMGREDCLARGGKVQ